MKKITLLVVLVFSAAVFAQAQIALGVKGGLNFANISVEDALEDPDSRTGFHFGAFAEVELGGVHLQPELLFSTKGADFAGSELELSYLEIPILIKKQFAQILNIHAGPQFGILTNAEQEGVEVDEFLKSADISLVVGAGINLPAGLVGGARYVYGISDIDDGFGAEIQNRTFQVYVGWKFAGN
ncbi:MAG: porin family protein [Fulvivirga sp.]|nr:porin family protein [Fulvivirga sp.]